jgi:hypothetical protein
VIVRRRALCGASFQSPEENQAYFDAKYLVKFHIEVCSSSRSIEIHIDIVKLDTLTY